jgi:predicted O-methyltransferase YrrM
MDQATAYDIIARVCEPGPSLQQLPGWCTVPKGKRLVDIAQSMPAEARCVELGVHGGRSLIALGAGLRLADRGGHVVGIDSYTRDDCMEGHHTDSELDKNLDQLWSGTDYENLLNVASHAIELHGLAAFVSIVRKRADDAVHDYADGAIDLIHLDANHSEPASCRDIVTWLPKMAPSSTWICDDVNWPSMTKALDLLVAGGFKRVELGAEQYWAVYRREA